ncbi:hypothetical protein COCSUDRAFT_52906 [Coccomyxa subellipsoidea C-169]|uniref:Uncharacterized protein n=1 Tax=Coccomyxa subellipsoidea (strain C-169) TaxID=574566 RepID=I0Z4G4_COCSC|nr:hypothetical protein COCSUDRAFT_52906 [Coccomyxa subellipsoidea C-169]EIE25533.1 hypothetical protein COCSUDRAFT_52906 [Coccomyxa subellipsoidea C-169]|eukprot:XP_005650077.1 hypothetical protein COCSUDRAFT_52906 [Coccomyxa subellipsoidea C-169]
MDISVGSGQSTTMKAICTQLTSLRFFQCPRQARQTICRSQNMTSSSESGSRKTDASNSNVPWTLMGRTIKPDRDHGSDLEDIIDQPQSLDSQSEELKTLLPDLAEQLKLNRQVAQRLAEDIPALAMKLVKLREIFPESNVLDMVGRRPSMLLDEEFDLIEGNLKRLHDSLPGADVVSLVEQQPLFLFEDVEVIMGELRRLLPGDPAEHLSKNPNLLVLAMSNRRLSIW